MVGAVMNLEVWMLLLEGPGAGLVAHACPASVGAEILALRSLCVATDWAGSCLEMIHLPSTSRDIWGPVSRLAQLCGTLVGLRRELTSSSFLEAFSFFIYDIILCNEGCSWACSLGWQTEGPYVMVGTASTSTLQSFADCFLFLWFGNLCN